MGSSVGMGDAPRGTQQRIVVGTALGQPVGRDRRGGGRNVVSVEQDRRGAGDFSQPAGHGLGASRPRDGSATTSAGAVIAAASRASGSAAVSGVNRGASAAAIRARAAASGSITNAVGRVGGSTAAASPVGRSTWNSAPWPGVDTTPTAPCMRSTSTCVMCRPSPVPVPTRRSRSSACENFSKMRARNASGMPPPWSRTAMRARAPSRVPRTSTALPAGEFLMAFDSRFAITCRKRSGSTHTSQSKRAPTRVRCTPTRRA